MFRFSFEEGVSSRDLGAGRRAEVDVHPLKRSKVALFDPVTVICCVLDSMAHIVPNAPFPDGRVRNECKDEATSITARGAAAAASASAGPMAPAATTPAAATTPPAATTTTASTAAAAADGAG